MRSCGCDIDIGVFGHIICWSQPFPYGKHFTCRCTTCPCTICHKPGQVWTATPTAATVTVSV
jgi:hypothetical protein